MFAVSPFEKRITNGANDVKHNITVLGFVMSLFVYEGT
jgi:hypothetical protein